ncbi:hypothetical protein niasHS_006523 [Heterodera schachtii]|uniref:Fibronectin type-III domain-containing protein n=1 Tax=Heterodera schachtii TaxID=97005 RepID=A0ABD2JHI3_HETSC
MSKTKQFFNELQRIAGSSPTKSPSSLHMKRAYESERWFSPRVDSDQADTSGPPRRSMLTQSRLQLLSAQRGRETRKPYWRCPMPSARPIDTEITQPSLVDIIATPLARQGPIKPFRHREPETGRKTNSFAVDEDILTVEEKEKELMSKVQPLKAPKAGFLGTPPPPLVDLFEFSDIIVRGPQLETKDIGTQVSFPEPSSAFGGQQPARNFNGFSAPVNVVAATQVPFSEPQSTFGGFGGQQQQPPSNSNGLSAPVGVVAETVSSSQIRLSWTDPNGSAFNQMYTIKYGISNSDESEHKQLNTTKTEHIFDGLRPDTLYEFAVRLAQSSHWSLNALNRTHPAPPPAPPSDSIVNANGPQLNNQQTDTGLGNIVPLAWQPPKFTNGGIQGQSESNPMPFGGGFSFTTTVPPAANGPFQFGAAPPVANGNVFQFAETTDSAVSTNVRHGVTARKLLHARRKKR